jgi:hypothetical protein
VESLGIWNSIAAAADALFEAPEGFPKGLSRSLVELSSRTIASSFFSTAWRGNFTKRSHWLDSENGDVSFSPLSNFAQTCGGVNAKIGWPLCFGNAWGNDILNANTPRVPRLCFRIGVVGPIITRGHVLYANPMASSRR